MTKNNLKVLLFASLIAMMILPFSSYNITEAITEDVDDDDQTHDKITIRTEKMQNEIMVAAAERLMELELRSEQTEDIDIQQSIKDEMERVISDARAKLPEVDRSTQLKYMIEVDYLTSVLLDKKIKQSDKRVIPFTTIGYDFISNSLVVGIQPDYATVGNMTEYASLLKEMVHSDVTIVLQPGDVWTSSACTSSDSTCNPIQAGVKMQVEGQGSCTVGFKATYDGASGFVTAGHCADGNTGDDVGQPTIANIIGSVLEESFDAGSSREYCDCAFIQTTIDVAEKILGLSSNRYPDHTHTVSDNDWVKMYGGVSGTRIGYVEDWSGSIYLTSSHTTLKHVAITTYTSTNGDSGSPVIQAYNPDPGFAGINVAWSSQGNSAFVKHYKITSEFSGLSWGF